MSNTKNNGGPVSKIKKITSISIYLGMLRSLRKQQKNGTTIFFRGSANIEWFDIPSVYRDKNHIENEQKMYHDIISRCPDNFSHCNSTLEHLVMMQHYKLPTRLLDITENPLVALYFACLPDVKTSYDGKAKIVKDILCDGKVSIYQIDDYDIKNYNSDTASLVANLTRIDKDFNILTVKCDRHFNAFIECLKELTIALRASATTLVINDIESRLMSHFGTLFDIWRNLYEKQKNEKLSLDNVAHRAHVLTETVALMCKKIENFDGEISNRSYYKHISDQIAKRRFDKSNEPLGNMIDKGRYYSLDRLIHFIQDDKPYFDPARLVLTDFESVVCVKTKQNNPRIIKQAGSFFLFGVKKNSTTKLECARITDNKYFNINGQRVECIIPYKSKEKILKELETLSISESHLFPEIDYIAKNIKEKYKGKI